MSSLSPNGPGTVAGSGGVQTLGSFPYDDHRLALAARTSESDSGKVTKWAQPETSVRRWYITPPNRACLSNAQPALCSTSAVRSSGSIAPPSRRFHRDIKGPVARAPWCHPRRNKLEIYTETNENSEAAYMGTISKCMDLSVEIPARVMGSSRVEELAHRFCATAEQVLSQLGSQDPLVAVQKHLRSRAQADQSRWFNHWVVLARPDEEGTLVEKTTKDYTLKCRPKADGLTMSIHPSKTHGDASNVQQHQLVHLVDLTSAESLELQDYMRSPKFAGRWGFQYLASPCIVHSDYGYDDMGWTRSLKASAPIVDKWEIAPSADITPDRPSHQSLGVHSFGQNRSMTCRLEVSRLVQAGIPSRYAMRFCAEAANNLLRSRKAPESPVTVVASILQDWSAGKTPDHPNPMGKSWRVQNIHKSALSEATEVLTLYGADHQLKGSLDPQTASLIFTRSPNLAYRNKSEHPVPRVSTAQLTRSLVLTFGTDDLFQQETSAFLDSSRKPRGLSSVATLDT